MKGEIISCEIGKHSHKCGSLFTEIQDHNPDVVYDKHLMFNNNNHPRVIKFMQKVKDFVGVELDKGGVYKQRNEEIEKRLREQKHDGEKLSPRSLNYFSYDDLNLSTCNTDGVLQTQGVRNRYEDFIDNIRYFLEECDHIHALNFLFDTENVCSTLAIKTVMEIKDSYMKNNLFCFPLLIGEEDGKEKENILYSLLPYYKLKDSVKQLIPINLTHCFQNKQLGYIHTSLLFETIISPMKYNEQINPSYYYTNTLPKFNFVSSCLFYPREKTVYDTSMYCSLDLQKQNIGYCRGDISLFSCLNNSDIIAVPNLIHQNRNNEENFPAGSFFQEDIKFPYEATTSLNKIFQREKVLNLETGEDQEIVEFFETFATEKKTQY
eukprot:snap_masked-scaffold_32-processed-gene-3.1-mRNA-1 protein AED:1.00 eAED:1.00 QI:0/-1/0/0/-1/1/1/0/377